MTCRAITVVLLAPVLLASCGSGGSSPGSKPARSEPGSSSEKRTSQPAAERNQAAARLSFHRSGHLPAPLQLPATTALPRGRTLVIGGLSAADTSTDGIVLVEPAGAARAVGRLPRPLHDGAAAAIGGHTYFFGGGDLGSSDEILRVTASGRTSSAGKLPVAASDVAAATIGSTAYVVGGYTGSAPLRSILAFSPGRPIRTAAIMPRPLRYAAVAAVSDSILIAGGTSGTAAQRAILRLDPATGRIERLGELPHPITHAAGATLNGRFYVVGGRGNALGSAYATIWSVDPATGSVRAAGRLPTPLSDLGAASQSNGIVAVGGRDALGRVHDDVLSTGTTSR